jgi:ERCC4-type nuclease
MLLVSPAEPKLLRDLGETSTLCEERGVDFLLTSPAGLVGIQRKEVRDLVASIRDDRICRELGQSKDLTQTVLLVEGDWRWQANGQSLTCDGFSRSQLDGLLLSFQANGWWVLQSANIKETCEVIQRVKNWFSRGDHLSLLTRPKSRAPWGTHKNREWGIHVWQSFDGIGVKVAGDLYDALGLPMQWTVSEKELLGVKGIGKGRVKKLLAALDSTGMGDTPNPSSTGRDTDE